MIQDFSVKGGPSVGRTNLPILRSVMAKEGIDVLYIPHDDEFQNEYLPDANERLAWATGFTGSAGSSFVFADRAVLLVDGRYTIQAQNQTDSTLFEVVDLPQSGPFEWLAEQNLSEAKVGYSPALSSPRDVRKLEQMVQKNSGCSVELKVHPVDAAWKDRPSLPREKVFPHPDKYSGESTSSKRQRISAIVKSRGADATVITAPASIAWLFNIRGGDVRHSPLPLSQAILYTDGRAELFLDAVKVHQAVQDHIGNDVRIYSPDQFEMQLRSLSNKTVSVDPNVTSAWYFNKLEELGAKILPAQDPVILPRATKNATEIQGTTAAHERDSIALVRFLKWLSEDGQSGDVTEIDAARKLEGFRSELPELRDLSFETISGAGPNSALPHYRVNTESNRKLEKGTLYLVDSGGQYLDGTTDVTRTIPIGEPTKKMRRHYTLVLKAHIALATARFPMGTTGTHLDTVARLPLWKAGLDFDHGTGHGVGVYLGVHEGPQRIAKPWYPSPLLPGMIVSNEPGYYEPGSYGIRIENLQYVVEATDIDGGTTPMLGFQNLTWAPLSRELIDTSLLTEEEHKWVNDYHSETLSRIKPELTDGDGRWLDLMCAML